MSSSSRPRTSPTEKARKRGPSGREPERPGRRFASTFTRLTFSWLPIILFASFFAVQCDRYLTLRREEAPVRPQDELELALEKVSDTYRVDEMITELEELGRGALAPIEIDGRDVWPTDEVCLREGFGDADAGDWVTEPRVSVFDGKRYRFRSTGQLALARDVGLYAVDTGRDSSLRAQLHIVSGPVQHATVDVSAFHDDAGALGAFDACTYRTEEDGQSEPKIGIFRLERRNPNTDSNSDAWTNITLTIPNNLDPDQYLPSLKLGRFNFDVTLHDGLTLDEVDIKTSGSLHAEGRVEVVGIKARTYGARGAVSGHFDVMNGDASVYTDGAPIEARVDVTRTQERAGKTQALELVATNAKLDVQLLLQDQADDCDPSLRPRPAKNCAWVRPFAFDIRATSSNYPQRVTLLDGSSYPPGARIFARAINAPVTLVLDSSFEGTYVARTGKHALGAGKQGEIGAVDPSGRGRERVFLEGLANRHVFSGAVGWGSMDAARDGASDAEVEVDEGMHMAYVDIRPSYFRRVR